MSRLLKMYGFFKDEFLIFLNYTRACVYVWMSVPECKCSTESEVSDYPGARVIDNYEQPYTSAGNQTHQVIPLTPETSNF